jgi:hypothetical protein
LIGKIFSNLELHYTLIAFVLTFFIKVIAYKVITISSIIIIEIKTPFNPRIVVNKISKMKFTIVVLIVKIIYILFKLKANINCRKGREIAINKGINKAILKYFEINGI